MKVYPIYLTRLDEKKTVIIGGNDEAERKVKELLDVDANITLIADTLDASLHELVKNNSKRVDWIKRRYKEGDLEGAHLVIVGEFEGDENRRIHEEAQERDVLVNVMDDIPNSNFAFGSLVKRGPLTVSISTSGSAPALAVRFRQKLESLFGDEHGRFLELAQNLRKPMAKHYDTFNERKRRWYNLVDSDVIELIKIGDEEAAFKKAAQFVGRQVMEEALVTLRNGEKDKPNADENIH